MQLSLYCWWCWALVLSVITTWGHVSLEQLGSEYTGAMLLNRKMEHRKCGHTVGQVSARDCITSVIGMGPKRRRLRLSCGT